MRIDAHQHYWSMSRNDYGWINKESPILYRDFLPQDYEIHLEKHNIDGSIVVQAAPTIEESEYLLELANLSDSILGVVGWLDLFTPSHKEHFDRFRKSKKFVGFRIMLQEMVDVSRVLERPYLEALKYYATLDIPIDILVQENQLAVLNELLKEVPDLRGVINHIGKPRIKEHLFEPWEFLMGEIAKHPKIYCKISGMVTEADHDDWDVEHFKPYIEHILRLFGPERIMFGSDWPVCLLAASYDDVLGILNNTIPQSWVEENRSGLFGENARKFYKLR
ncbi:amidohydrolase family protein [Paenibacillus illinoisensis]|uniref:Putative TIM-barrel fold metal-dependent hydrolase n=1 Tax=Paenibacillus illinoisensis TaxID=59845 RepID=A0A2W0CC33_9BACL|nr:amidohydrolase family protein [Paenibacillus illinoisensis]PYY25885.1 putative TIM-barrel fold metal-dependent hydrolase [Paenibacillus illinoisensis]